MKLTRILTIASCVLFTAPSFAADTVDFARYMQSPASISAIASAVASVGACSVPLEFDETKSEDETRLGIHCRGTEDDESSIFVRFVDDGYSIIPKGFDYAG
ncbi:MAG: hypothetical protein ACSHYC_22880 [Alphaproteobacteria bacterium]